MFNFYQNICFITNHKQPVMEGNKSTTNGNWTLLPDSSGINFDLFLPITATVYIHVTKVIKLKFLQSVCLVFTSLCYSSKKFELALWSDRNESKSLEIFCIAHKNLHKGHIIDFKINKLLRDDRYFFSYPRQHVKQLWGD